MLKFVRYLLCTAFFISPSFASNSVDEDSNQLEGILNSLFGGKVSVKVDSEQETVRLIGTEENVNEALVHLGDFDFLRTQFLPVDRRVGHTHASDKSIDSWTDFIKANGINLKEFDMFNISSDRIADDRGVVTFETPSSLDRGFVRLYIEALQDKSQFFNWALHNLHGFLEGDDTKTVIHYALLAEFLYLEPKSPLSQVDDSEDFSILFSSQSVLKHLLAAVCGDVALVPEEEGSYSVKTLSLGDKPSYTTATLEILVDKSYSMCGNAIGTVNREIPEFLRALQATLPVGVFVTVHLKAFDDQIDDVAIFDIGRDTVLPILDPIKVRGGTDLTLIEDSLVTKANERKVLVAFTDGNHQSPSNLSTSMEKMRDLVRSGKPFAKPKLCKVGGESSVFFEKVADIFGGSYSTESNISGFCGSVISEMTQLMISRTNLVFQLAGENVVVKWARNDLPGIFSVSQRVNEGDSIISNGITYLVDQSVVNYGDETIVLTPEEERLAKIQALEEELSRLKSGD
ncbi:MAG: VWA domain-containing protein [Alphaproteobacteria bacterium]|nr:VWA domain-containing protein [Alphaproteobacteria bacterium]NCQ67287.1 VWA domain-containing protein [Alphaproteobacteria bacterium]NCT06746.1 VWA domain-containing protein [Alphaproteobacteria bacterium]